MSQINVDIVKMTKTNYFKLLCFIGNSVDDDDDDEANCGMHDKNERDDEDDHNSAADDDKDNDDVYYDNILESGETEDDVGNYNIFLIAYQGA